MMLICVEVACHADIVGVEWDMKVHETAHSTQD